MNQNLTQTMMTATELSAQYCLWDEGWSKFQKTKRVKYLDSARGVKFVSDLAFACKLELTVLHMEFRMLL